MKGEILAYEFEDRYSLCAESNDPAVQRIVKVLDGGHSDIVKHPVSVTSDGWETLRRIVAFLATDLDIAAGSEPPWPFREKADWQKSEHLVHAAGLPSFDPRIHCRPIHPWWDRIPTSIGILMILLSIGAMIFGIISRS